MNILASSRQRRLAAGAVSLALVTAACGSDDAATDDAATGTPAVEASAPPADDSEAPAASDATNADPVTTDTASETPATEGAELFTFVSDSSFADTEAALSAAVVDNGMMMLGDLNQAGALSATGLELEGAHSYFVGNPSAGSMFFEATPAIGAVIPLQMHVWTDDDSVAYVSYFDPAPQFAAIDPALAEGGGQMAQAASMIAAAATGNADAGAATVTGGDQTHEWMVVDAPGGFDETLDGLKQMVADNGMMVLGELDEAGALQAAGLDLEGSYSLFVGNPSAGKTFFEQTAAIGTVVPIRVQVWADDGGTHVGYFDPAPMFAAVDPALAEAGVTMAGALSMMTSALG